MADKVTSKQATANQKKTPAGNGGDSSDNDTGMYTEPLSKYSQETKLLRQRIQPPQTPGRGDSAIYSPVSSSYVSR